MHVVLLLKVMPTLILAMKTLKELGPGEIDFITPEGVPGSAEARRQDANLFLFSGYIMDIQLYL